MESKELKGEKERKKWWLERGVSVREWEKKEGESLDIEKRSAKREKEREDEMGQERGKREIK